MTLEQNHRNPMNSKLCFWGMSIVHRTMIANPVIPYGHLYVVILPNPPPYVPGGDINPGKFGPVMGKINIFSVKPPHWVKLHQQRTKQELNT